MAQVGRHMLERWRPLPSTYPEGKGSDQNIYLGLYQYSPGKRREILRNINGKANSKVPREEKNGLDIKRKEIVDYLTLLWEHQNWNNTRSVYQVW